MMELHLSCESPPAHVYYLNGKRIEGRGHHIGGTHARTLLSPQCAGYAIFRYAADNGWRDIQMNNSETIPMGARLYSVPPANR